jgi:nanoRNase/pAp phosphatase (c-di-AMP/oligoRNAs hydrolase)
MISDVVGQLSDGYPFAACFFQVDNGWVYSLRSSNGFDVSELAKSMGGGGHQAASGLKSDQIIHKIIRKLDVKK